MDIEEADLRVVVRLLGETAALPGGLMEKKTYLLDSLCDIAGAAEWVWAHICPTAVQGSFFVRRKVGRNSCLPMEFREELDRPLLSEPTPSHVIRSEVDLNADIRSNILLLRDSRKPSYTRRECALVMLVLEEIPWLHWREWKDPPSERQRLSPRLQMTMDLLLSGLGRKEIAARMAISEGTVSGYIRGLYRYFGVNSQAELMSLPLKESTLQLLP